jgi:radical SAM superfamily enzyme YgiQ (UPF0313 family)
MKKISFVNPNFQQGPQSLNAYYLPYTAGVLWAYAATSEIVSNNFKLEEFIWRREKIDDVVNRLKDQDVVGFCCYIWNNNYNNTLASRLKQANPDICILYGGPQPPIEKDNFFDILPFVDIWVKTEGEITFKRILEAIATTEDFKKIPGMLYNDNGKLIDTGPSERIQNLDDIPSPYLTGLFDDLIKNHPEVSWNGTLETNRGCPYACTFCDWGSLTYTKIKKFNIDRVFGELEWMGKNQIDFISITDANFGIFPERDMAIATKLVEVQHEYQNPRNYTISWAKNQKSEVIDIVKKLMRDGGSTYGLNLSVQTLDEKTLEIIKRKNLAMNKVKEVFDECELNNIPLYTELILGLPGETLESWKNNFYKLYESGNHTGITVYQAQLLENAEMNLTQRNLYNIEGIMVYDYLPGILDNEEIQEGIEIVSSTLDLPHEKMLETQIFSWFQTTFHINGLTNYVSRFLRKYIDEDYSEFYHKLFQYIQQDQFLLSEIERITTYSRNWLTTGLINHPDICGIEIYGWNLIHSTLIKLHADGKIGHVIDVVNRFVRDHYSDCFVDNELLLEELLDFQNTYLVDQAALNNYPKNNTYQHDILGYLQTGTDLVKETAVTFEFPEDKNISLQTFCEKIFYDRRKNFGKARVTVNDSCL